MRFVRGVLSFLLVFSFNLKAHDLQSAYSLLFVLLEQGRVRVARHQLAPDDSRMQSLFTLDLADKNNGYTTLVCNQETSGGVVVRSDNDIMCDYYLNWGTMVGVDLGQRDAAVQISAHIAANEQGRQKIVVSGTAYNENVATEIPLETDAQSVVAFVVPAELIEKMSVNANVMPFSQCCCLGIIVAKSRNEVVQNSAIDQEIEFDTMLDAMLQDGTIKIQPVSPFMAALRTFGSTIFVKYLALKKAITLWWNRPSTQVQQVTDGTEQHNGGMDDLLKCNKVMHGTEQPIAQA